MSREDSTEKIERFLIEQDEIEQLGHRIVYDRKTGNSKNIFGCMVDPSKLDEHGYQVKL